MIVESDDQRVSDRFPNKPPILTPCNHYHMNDMDECKITVIECSPEDVKQVPPRWRKYLLLSALTIVLLGLAIVLVLVIVDQRHDLTGRYLGRSGNGISKYGSNQKMMASSSDNNYMFSGDQHDDHDDEHEEMHNFHGRPAISSSSICMTPGCVRAAAQVLNYMDNETEPCEDFYKFACGRWIETQQIPDFKTSLSSFSQITAELNANLRALIERKARDSDPPIVGQMRNMYASCMNLSDIEARGDQPLLEVLRYFGGWPVAPATMPITSGNQISRGANSILSKRQIDNFNQQFNWLDTIIKFRERGFSHDMLLDLSVVPDSRNSRRFMIELDQSSLGLPDRSYYSRGMNDTTYAAYYELMVESAVMLGAERQDAMKQMREALDFENALSRIAVPREQRRNATRLYNKMVAKDLNKLAPNIDWQKYLSALLRDDKLNLNVDEVIVRVPSFLKSIDSLLVKTEPRVVANYMMWRIVRGSHSGLSRKWRELAHSYSQILSGRQSEEPRWEQCLGSFSGTLGHALSAFYVKNHFNRKSKANALEMVEYIREEFLRILDEIDWMDEETRKEAKIKARAIAPFIGYPDELLQDELVEELYKDLGFDKTNFYQNIRRARLWSTNYAFGQLRKPNKRGDWKKHARAAEVNAYYNRHENSIDFPAGILQGAFFDAERPNYMNYGAIGFVIGHEITHGFDDRGRQFDKDGNNRNWWNEDTDQKFKERAQCIIEQYSNYTVPETGMKVNGVNTQGENIADNGGLKEAFRAYRRWVQRNGPEPRLPGISMSPEKLFWISAANIWCGKYRPELMKVRVAAGSHSPAQFRILGPMSNLKEFSETFNCPLGSPLNPVKKCAVW